MYLRLERSLWLVLFLVIRAIFLLSCVPVSQQYLFLSQHGDVSFPACKSTKVRPTIPFLDRANIIHRSTTDHYRFSLPHKILTDLIIIPTFSIISNYLKYQIMFDLCCVFTIRVMCTGVCSMYGYIIYATFPSVQNGQKSSTALLITI